MKFVIIPVVLLAVSLDLVNAVSTGAAMIYAPAMMNAVNGRSIGNKYQTQYISKNRIMAANVGSGLIDTILIGTRVIPILGAIPGAMSGAAKAAIMGSSVKKGAHAGAISGLYGFYGLGPKTQAKAANRAFYGEKILPIEFRGQDLSGSELFGSNLVPHIKDAHHRKINYRMKMSTMRPKQDARTHLSHGTTEPYHPQPSAPSL